MRELWSMSSLVHCALDNYILNDWCCYPAIFKHYHWETFIRCHSIQWMMCLLSLSYVYIQFSRQLHAKNTATRRQISSSIIIIYHMCMYRCERLHFFGGREMESMSIERMTNIILHQDIDDPTEVYRLLVR